MVRQPSHTATTATTAATPSRLPSPGLPCRQHPIDVVGLDDLTPSLALDGILTLAHAPVTGALVDSIDRSKLKIVSN